MKYKYEKIDNFIRRARTSRASVYRFYKKYPDLFAETIKKKIPRLYPVNHAKFFDRGVLVDDVRALELENSSMRNIIDHLMDRDSLQTKLWEMEWTFFGTIAYSSDLDKKVCYRLMNTMYNELESRYGDITDLRLFFTTEPFDVRNGYHNHFVINTSNTMLAESIAEDITEFFKYDRVDIVGYDKYKAGLFYMTKKGLINEDWDILYNKLDEKAIKDAS
jgi:hypothetical protein